MNDNSNIQPTTVMPWRGNAPVSSEFDDVYYSAENGLEETRFVFLKGIGAPDVWQDQDHFVIGETGFGTGLNFLATWQAWMESGAKGRLTFISVEGYPLSKQALEEAHETFPELSSYAAKLRAAWPPASKGFHPRHFENGKVNLILLFGQAAEAFSRLSASVDAWFLDGFAPAKNPDMWSDAILDQVARLSKKSTRFATFTAAGFVKRALRDRGFEVRKEPGYGRKRERLVGVAENPSPRSHPTFTPPEWAAVAPAPTGTVAVIGAGIAGASVAAALTRRGRDVQLVNHPNHKSASSVPAAILAPRFIQEQNSVAAFFTAAYAYSCSFPAYESAWANEPGVTMLPKDHADTDRLAKVAENLGWSTDWLVPHEAGFYLPHGGSVDSGKAIAALVDGIPTATLDVTRLERTEHGWLLHPADGACPMEAACVVIAAGIETYDLLNTIDCPELRPNRGQVEMIDGNTSRELPPESFAFGGYITATIGNERTLGSTFDRMESIDANSYAPSAEDRQRILDGLKNALGTAVEEHKIKASWAGVRATTPDHLPYVGPVCDGQAAQAQYAPLAKDAKTKGLGAPTVYPGLYLLAGLGSKGFQYGPFLGDYLAAQICGDPLPVPSDLMARLHPLRGLIRKVKRSDT